MDEPLESLSLVATFIASPGLWPKLPGLLAAWQTRGVMRNGTATWLDIPPEQATYDTIMAVDGPPSHETLWHGGPAQLIAHAQQYTLSTLNFPFAWAQTSGGMLLHLTAEEDDSIEMYVDTPIDDVLDEQHKNISKENLSRFIDFACALFVPELFVTGYIGVEASFGGLDKLRTGKEPMPADWAFYGASIAPFLKIVLSSQREQALEIREIAKDGFFIRWSNWGSPRLVRSRVPTAWKSALRDVAERI